MAGRKSLKDELQILRRYADLSEPYFKVLKDHLNSESKEDQRWAADNLKSAFAKMIPQKLEGAGDDGEFVLKVVNYASSGNNDTSQLRAENIPATAPTSD
jgi:hypothetical protein